MKQMQSPAAAADDEVSFMHIDETDFSAMSRPEQIRHLEVEGYVVFPRILPPDDRPRLKRRTGRGGDGAHQLQHAARRDPSQQPQWFSRTAAN